MFKEVEVLAGLNEGDLFYFAVIPQILNFNSELTEMIRSDGKSIKISAKKCKTHYLANVYEGKNIKIEFGQVNVLNSILLDISKFRRLHGLTYFGSDVCNIKVIIPESIKQIQDISRSIKCSKRSSQYVPSIMEDNTISNQA